MLTLDTAGSADDVNLTLKDNDNFAFNASSQQLYVKSELDADITNAAPTYRLTINCREANKQPVGIADFFLLLLLLQWDFFFNGNRRNELEFGFLRIRKNASVELDFVLMELIGLNRILFKQD